VLNVPKSATLAINEKSRQLQKEGRDIIRLGLGQSPFPVPDIMVRELRSYARAKDYMAVQGYLPLRDAIAGFIQRTEYLDRSAADVIVGPGSKELLFGLQMVLDCDLVLPAPSWVSYEPQAKLLGKQVHWLECRAEEGWKLSAETLQQHCKKHPDRQQLLILNSPNNPSGACFNEAELKALAAVAQAHNVIILSDEIYSELHFSGEHQSIARFYPQGTIISNGISKWAGAGGWRLGFFIFPPELRAVLELMIVIASETFTSVSAPIQMASIRAFEDSSEILDYIHACRAIMRHIGEHFHVLLVDYDLHLVKPDGGFYALVDFENYRTALEKHGITTAQKLCESMLEQCGVAALPGSDFGLPRGLQVRFALVDFDSAELLQETIRNGGRLADADPPALDHLFSAATRLGDWVRSL
jgi:aspartate aminotransferase